MLATQQKQITKIYKKNLFKFMRQTPNNFNIIKSIEISFLYRFKTISYTYYFSFTNCNPLQFALFPLFSSKRTTFSLSLSLSLSLSHVVPILPNVRMAIINTFNRFTSSACERHSKSLPNKWQEDFVRTYVFLMLQNICHDFM